MEENGNERWRRVRKGKEIGRWGRNSRKLVLSGTSFLVFD